MAARLKKGERAEKSRAYRRLVKSIAQTNVFPTASSIFDCLSMARTNENCARSIELLREEAIKEGAEATSPNELSFAAIAQYLVKAARLYATAGAKCTQTPDLGRAYTYYHRAARCMRRAIELESPGGMELRAESQEFTVRAAILRQQCARQSLCRRRLSLGFLRRSR
jgi:hypothetical protein